MFLRSTALRAAKNVRSSSVGLVNTNKAVQKVQFQNVRYNSTTKEAAAGQITSAASEIQSQLPSFDATTEAAAQASQVIGEASSHWGYLQSIGLAKSWWWPPDLIQHLLEIVHVSTGLPWWGTIALVTVGVRALLFPIYVKSSDMMAKNAKIKPQLDEIQATLMNADDMAASQTAILKRKKLLAKHGIKNRYLAAPILQLPLAIGFFSGIRSMANYPVDGFQDQGILWFQDLTAADPYLGLQCLSAAVIMGFMRLGGETGAQNFSPVMKKILTIIPLISIPATMSFSSGVVLYFFVNGLFSILQTTILKAKWFRKTFGLADLVTPPPRDPSLPQEGIMDSFKKNMEKARLQAQKKAEARAKEEELKEKAEHQKANSHIKIVKRSDLRKK